MQIKPDSVSQSTMHVCTELPRAGVKLVVYTIDPLLYDHPQNHIGVVV